MGFIDGSDKGELEVINERDKGKSLELHETLQLVTRYSRSTTEMYLLLIKPLDLFSSATYAVHIAST